MYVSRGLPPFFLRAKEFLLDRQLVLELEEPLQSLGLTVEELSDPIGQGVKPEVGDAEDALRGPEHMAGQDPEFYSVFVIWGKWTE